MRARALPAAVASLGLTAVQAPTPTRQPAPAEVEPDDLAKLPAFPEAAR